MWRFLKELRRLDLVCTSIHAAAKHRFARGRNSCKSSNLTKSIQSRYNSFEIAGHFNRFPFQIQWISFLNRWISIQFQRNSYPIGNSMECLSKFNRFPFQIQSISFLKSKLKRLANTTNSWEKAGSVKMPTNSSLVVCFGRGKLRAKPTPSVPLRPFSEGSPDGGKNPGARRWNDTVRTWSVW